MGKIITVSLSLQFFIKTLLLLVTNVEEKNSKPTIYLETLETLRIRVLYFFVKNLAGILAVFLSYNLMIWRECLFYALANCHTPF